MRQRTLVQRFAPILILSITLLASGRAQSVAIPLRHEIYEFLKKMESKQLITDYHDIVKPISRLEAAELLVSIEQHADALSSVDLRRLTFFQNEFGHEIGMKNLSWREAPRRWHPLTFILNEGILNGDLLAGFAEKRFDTKRVQKITNGFRLYGYAFKNIGFSFTFADNREQGTLQDRTKALSPDDGVILTKRGGDFYEYDFTEVQLTYSTGDMIFALEKVPQSWSTGRRGSLSLSSKAPSMPQIRMTAKLTDWMTFTYIHGELNSQVLDSSRSYRTHSSTIRDFYRPVYRQKYIASHMIELTPIRGLDLSLGESIVYSDRNPSLMYLLPVMFFKSGEHYNNDTDNSQFHVSLDATLIPRVNLYGSVIIDEIAIADLFDPERVRNQLGYTVGVHSYDIPLDDIELNIEYTRINPWTYYHKFPAARFTNNGYDMGHWIGQNADNLFAELIYRPIRQVRASAWYESFRKGGLDDVHFQYTIPSKPFLYGPVRKEQSVGFAVRYQPARDLFVDGRIRSFSVSDEANPSADHSSKLEYQVQIQYGIW
jgi:hypothetical protein